MSKALSLIAEKPSYSRGPDGKTPFGVVTYQSTIAGLQAETATKTDLARSMGRGAQAARDYMSAEGCRGQIGLVKKQEGVFRRSEEDSRQADERAKLSKAYKIEKARFEAEWAERFVEVNAMCVEKEEILKEVHEVARADCEKEIEKKIVRWQPTSTLLQLEDTEKKLARLNEFKQAAEVAARAHKQRTLELSVYERQKQAAGSRPRAALAELQGTEMRNLMQKCHAMRVAVRREKEQAFEVFTQKYRNLEADLGHSHAIEVPMGMLRAEIGAVQSQKSRSTQSSTFRGTLKFESLAGTKFDVAGVSTLDPIPDNETARAAVTSVTEQSKAARRAMVDVLK